MATLNAAFYIWQNARELQFKIYEATYNFTAKGILSEANITLQGVWNETRTASYSVGLGRLVNFDVGLLEKNENRPQSLKSPINRLITLVKKVESISLEDSLKHIHGTGFC